MLKALAMFGLLTAISPTFSLAQSGNTQQAKVDRPVENFEKLWTEFSDRYSFFELKGISKLDWYKKYRLQINEQTTNDQLFSICWEMLRELKDAHVGLSDESTGKTRHGGKPVRLLQDFPNQTALLSLLHVIDADLKKNSFGEMTRIKMEIPYLAGHIIEFSTSANLGYLRVNLMIGLDEAKFSQALDEAMEQFKNVAGVILDVRFNTGGYDTYSYVLAGKFADQKRLGHYRCTKTKAGFSELESWYIHPSGKTPFTKPVVLLTSGYTVSAGDVLALAMKQLPHVTIIGENTQGFFSDAFEGKLPNGWEFTLSNQHYFSVDKKNLEDIGIAPDIHAINTKRDVQEAKDPLLVKALEVLTRKPKQ